MLFYTTKIKNKTVDKIVNLIEKKKINFIDESPATATVKGFQSKNIENIFDDTLKKQMLDNQCLYQDIFHIHYIEYFNQGYQEEHNHFNTEEYSFILYLNDSTGDTVFPHKTIQPKKGLLVIFDSRFMHKGKKSLNKKILVGAIKAKNK